MTGQSSLTKHSGGGGGGGRATQVPFWQAQVLSWQVLVPHEMSLSLFEVTQRPELHVAFLHASLGGLHVENFCEQLQVLLPIGPTHFPVLH